MIIGIIFFEQFKLAKTLKNAILIMCLLFFCGCSAADMCANKPLAEYFNRTKNHKIIKFDRNCGATTANSIQLSVIPVEEDLENSAGNIFIANSLSGNDLKNDKSVLVSWLNDHTIKVKYDSRLKIFKKESANGKFKIIYEETLPH